MCARNLLNIHSIAKLHKKKFTETRFTLIYFAGNQYKMPFFKFFSVCPQMHSSGQELNQGDVILTNHPAAGGSHLPDLTVITPVCYNKGKMHILWIRFTHKHN